MNKVKVKRCDKIVLRTFPRYKKQHKTRGKQLLKEIKPIFEKYRDVPIIIMRNLGVEHTGNVVLLNNHEISKCVFINKQQIK